MIFLIFATAKNNIYETNCIIIEFGAHAGVAGIGQTTQAAVARRHTDGGMVQ
jgi:hypothetical protein